MDTVILIALTIAALAIVMLTLRTLELSHNLREAVKKRQRLNEVLDDTSEAIFSVTREEMSVILWLNKKYVSIKLLRFDKHKDYQSNLNDAIAALRTFESAVKH